MPSDDLSKAPRKQPSADTACLIGMASLAMAYTLLVLLMLVVGVASTGWDDLTRALSRGEIRHALWLSLTTATLSAALSLLFATPIAYLLSRGRQRLPVARRWRWQKAGVACVDALLDAPIVLPPLVVGVLLLLMLRQGPEWLRDRVVYETPAIVLAQFTVVCALAIRTLRATFDQLDDRQERIAMTLGGGRSIIFWRVVLPRAKHGLLAAATLSWARALGEFGPVLVLAGSTRMKTEVLTTSVYLELQAGDLRQALAVSVLLVACAMAALVGARIIAARGLE